MSLEKAFNFGCSYPMALKILAEKNGGDKHGESIDYILGEFLEQAKYLGFPVPSSLEEQLVYFSSEKFIKDASIKFSLDSEEKCLAWAAGRDAIALDWLLRHRDEGNQNIVAIEYLKIQVKTTLNKLGIESGDFIGLNDINASGLKNYFKEMDKKTSNNSVTKIEISGGNNNFQVGDNNKQVINNGINGLINYIENSNVPEQEKQEVKSQLKNLLKHPLLSAIAGGLIGSL